MNHLFPDPPRFYDTSHVRSFLSDPRHALPARNETSPVNETHALNLTAEQELDFGRLVEGFHFSRWFFVTYQAAIVGVVLIAAASRWHERRRGSWRRARRRRDDHEKSANDETAGLLRRPSQDDAAEELQERRRSHDAAIRSSRSGTSASTSSDSSRSGDDTPPTKREKSEVRSDSPLLSSPCGARSARQTRPSFPRPLSYLRACLIYQPPPLPLLRRIIPANSTTLIILPLLALNIWYLFFDITFYDSGTASYSILADRAGFLVVANLPWLYLMAAKNQPIKLLTGDSYENLNLIHRRQGEWMCFLAVVHFGGMILAWYLSLPKYYTFWGYLTIPYVSWGVGAWVAYEVLYLTSLSSFREWWYELFLASHVGLQIVALIALWLHHFRAQPYVGASLLIFVADRLIWRLGIKTTKIQAELQVMEDGETVKVSGNWATASRNSSWWRRWFGFNARSGWLPSEHVFITVPGISKKHSLQFHPMTIASAAPEDEGHAWFNLIIRAKEGFSRDLLDYARTHATATVRLDGPYGSLHALEMLHASDVSIIVAGGSGIAVAYPVLWNLLHHKPDTRHRIGLIWIVQDARHVSWITQERLDELKELGCHVLVPPPSRSHGRPDVRQLLKDSVHELSEDAGDKLGVVVSGPDSMNRDVRNECAALAWNGRDVEVSVEKFGW